MFDTAKFLARITTELDEQSPYGLAASLQTMLETASSWAGAGRWASLRPLADAVDDLLAAYEPSLAGNEAVTGLVTLTRQVCMILALMGDSEGVRDSGYFRASMVHARRLDAMTEGRLNLVSLVDVIQD